MKFRYKVLIINIILLSVGIGAVGFLMIEKNFNLALNSQIKNAIEENNMLQSTIEYELLDAAADSKNSLIKAIPHAGLDVTSSLSANQSALYIVYDDTLSYTNDDKSIAYPKELCSTTKMGKKEYTILNESGTMYIFVSSCSTVYDSNLNIINRRDITDAYTLMHSQIKYYRILLISVVSICSIAMFVISILLTRPLEELAKTSKAFGDGSYDLRTDIKSHDEVGELASTYNNMADQIEEHVNELEDMLIRKDQFVADFTHEIKTPMTSIIGYADTIRSKEMSRENQILAASYIFSEGKRLENMSKKLFDLIYTKQHDIAFEPFHTKKLAYDINSSTSPLLLEKDIILTMDVEDIILYGDLLLLRSAFINLIDNAKKASSSGSGIEFTGHITDDGETYEFIVKDYGIGIDEENLTKICDEFYMVDKSRSRNEGGAGLGLSLASLIFNRHNADFTITSKPNVGTTMYIRININQNKAVYEEKNNNAKN